MRQVIKWAFIALLFAVFLEFNRSRLRENWIVYPAERAEQRSQWPLWSSVRPCRFIPLITPPSKNSTFRRCKLLFDNT